MAFPTGVVLVAPVSPAFFSRGKPRDRPKRPEENTADCGSATAYSDRGRRRTGAFQRQPWKTSRRQICRAVDQMMGQLDPALRTEKLVTAWRPWVPEVWKAAAS